MVITHVNKFVTLVPVENVLDLGKDPVHVGNQCCFCLVRKMYLLVEIVVTKFLNVESIGVRSVVIEVPVKFVDRKLKSSVVVESILNACRVINRISVRQSVLKFVIARSTNVRESVVLETVHLVINSADGL